MEPIDFNKPINEYGEDNIQTLEWQEHVRMRPGMYIGNLVMAPRLMMGSISY